MLYRFAVLLTGSFSTAEEIVAGAVQDCSGQIDQLRDERHRTVCLLKNVRTRCLNRPDRSQPEGENLPEQPPAGSGIEQIEAGLLAKKFRIVSEPERTALALFYLDVAPPEVAHFLDMTLHELGDTLGRARNLLEEALIELEAEMETQPPARPETP